MLNSWGGVLEGAAFSVGHDHRRCALYIIHLSRWLRLPMCIPCKRRVENLLSDSNQARTASFVEATRVQSQLDEAESDHIAYLSLRIQATKIMEHSILEKK